MSSKSSIKVFESTSALASGLADFIIADAGQRIQEAGRYSLVLSGGSTPEALFRLLAEPSYANALDWGKVYVFWGDERAVPLNDERNNAHVAIQLWLDKISIPAANIYRIKSDLPAGEAARDYEQTIRAFFVQDVVAFDLVLLGLGPDGHTASLFPGSSLVRDAEHIVTSGYIATQGMDRISLTIPVVNQAHKVVFLVAGKAKADIVQMIVHDAAGKETYPAQMINPHSGGLYWFLDRAAAAQLL